MAQPPDITDTFVREVDENLRRDQLRDFARNYGGWLIAAVILFLAGSGGWIYWQYHQRQQSQHQVEQLADIYKQIGSSQADKAPQRLDQLAETGSSAVRATALFTRAALAIEQKDLKLATAKYREIATDEDLAKPFRDLALIRQTALEFDSLKPEDVIARLRPLAKPGEPWFGSAGEMTAVALIKQGKKEEAGRLYAAIAKDKNVPDALRARSVQIASTLGVDASSAMPAPAQ
ncbi:MAG TPA: tetratricopeptide repeat protein [Sphingomicrobium sp.]|nr:tetratricopeptide repeat protein [Sphingomicrobium sp.]